MFFKIDPLIQLTIIVMIAFMLSVFTFTDLSILTDHSERSEAPRFGQMH